MKTAEMNHVRRKSLFKLEGLWKAFVLCFPQAEDMKKHRVCLESARRMPVQTGAGGPSAGYREPGSHAARNYTGILWRF